MEQIKKISQTLGQILESKELPTETEIYEQLTGRKSSFYNTPLTDLLGTEFYNLDKALNESDKKSIKEQVEFLKRKYENLIQVNDKLLTKLPEDEKEGLLCSVKKQYDNIASFLEKFEGDQLIKYDQKFKSIEIIDKEGDLYWVNLNRNKVQSEVEGLKLKPCDNPPKDLFYHEIYGSKYGVFVFSLGACYHIAIPKLSKLGTKIGEEPEIIKNRVHLISHSNEENKKRLEDEDKDFIIVPNKPYCPHELEYLPNKDVLRWKTGAVEYHMDFHLPKHSESDPKEREE